MRDLGRPLRYMVGYIPLIASDHGNNANNRKEDTNVSFRVRVRVAIPNPFTILKTLFLSKVQFNLTASKGLVKMSETLLS